MKQQIHNNIQYVILVVALLINNHLLAQRDTTKTSVKMSQEVINPTTLAWQLQLEEFAIFKSMGSDEFAQNFRVRGIIPIQQGKLIKVPQLLRVIAFLNTAPGGPTGLGDITLNQFFILSKKRWGNLEQDGICKFLRLHLKN